VKRVPELPDSFIMKKKPSPSPSDLTYLDTILLRPQLAMEYDWLEKVTVPARPLEVTWSAHHASQKRGKPFEVKITSLLPLLRVQTYSVATVKHVLDKIKVILECLNPGQVPVTAATVSNRRVENFFRLIQRILPTTLLSSCRNTH